MKYKITALVIAIWAFELALGAVLPKLPSRIHPTVPVYLMGVHATFK